MKLLFFLGNPGIQYKNTRHNAGFIIADEIAKERGCADGTIDSKSQAHITSTTHDGEKRILIKPQTFMNLSGQSVAYLMGYYKLTPADIIIIHDDIELATNKIMYKYGGSARGQNGIKNIIQKIGTSDFARVRIGIGRPTHNDSDIASYVLSNFSDDEYNTLVLSTHTIISLIEQWSTSIKTAIAQKN